MTIPAIFLETSRTIIKIPVIGDINNWIILHSKSEEMTEDSNIVQDWLKSDIAHFEKHGFGMGSVFEKDSGEFIGRAGLVYLDHDDTQPDIEVGYVLRKIYWNRGYATELAKALIEWGFSHLDINKLVAVTQSNNKKSQHVLEKVGMRYTRTVHDKDFLLYELQKPIFQSPDINL